MISLVYKIPYNELQSEKEWLNMLNIFPSISKSVLNLPTGISYCHLGMIVSAEAAILIKLRRQVSIQYEYHRR